MMVAATSRLRMVAYCTLLTALAFVQAPGRIVGDTKFDLVADPVGFLARATQLWDPNAAFGQVQNQAYGYFWPMGPFFVAGELLRLPDWVVQRLWWAVLLCLAFVGTIKLARALAIGAAWAQVLAGFAFTLSVHILTLLGPTSVEAWPSALAPWVLLPLVHATQGGSIRRGAALSALAVAMCGGVNAVAVSAVLPLGALWILTRRWTARTWALFGWWVLFTVLATLWWVVPLLLLGRYSVPFLDYIENAPITTLPTSLADVLGGSSDWVAYIARDDWAAGNLLGTTPVLLVNAAVIAALGVAGIARRDAPHRTFLFLGLLTGIVLVSFGYTGPVSGWLAEDRAALLDAGLAPFRNLHKYDVVLRLSLVLGLAHFVTVFGQHARETADRLVRAMVIVVAATSVIGVAVPAYAGQLAPQGGFESVPRYWHRAAAYLEQNQDRGIALEIPASAFGDYRWGSPHDDVLQPLSSAPWAVRNIVPLAQPGNVRFLDAITRAVELGRPSQELAGFLALNGVGHLVVRNDLHPLRTTAPDPVVLHQVLDRSPGLTKVIEFGPATGAPALDDSKESIRILANRGRQAEYAAVEIYAVAGASGPVTAWDASSVPILAGEPGAGLVAGADVLDGPAILVGDRPRNRRGNPLVLTDGLKRRETAFTAVRQNHSATLTADDPWRLRSVVPNHRIYDDQPRFETVAAWIGIDSVEASSSQAQADAVPPIRVDQAPSAAFDGDPDTEWVSTGLEGAVGQWWRVNFSEPVDPDEITIVGGTPVGPRVSKLRLVTENGGEVVNAPRPGRSIDYDEVPPGRTSFLEIEAVEVEGGSRGGQFSLADVEVPGVEAGRVLVTPDVFEAAPDHVLLGREPNRPACALVVRTWACNDFWRTEGEEGESLDRLVRLAEGGRYDFDLTASVRTEAQAVRFVGERLPLQVRTSDQVSDDILASGLAAVDGDPYTAWVADDRDATMALRWDRPVTLSAIDFDLLQKTPAAAPEKVTLRAGDQQRTVALDDGRGTFPELVTDRLVIEFDAVEDVFSFEGRDAVRLHVGVGELSFPGSDAPAIDPRAELDLGCGSGPDVSVNGMGEDTRLSGSLRELMSGVPLAVEPCGDGLAALSAGPNRITVTSSEVARAERLHLRLRDGSDARSQAPERLPVRLKTWSAADRTVALGARTAPALLVVSENINPGWVARVDGVELEVQRMDGWKQGWLLPPGEATDVVLEFTPNDAYRTALLVGLGAALIVVLGALVPSSRRRRRVLEPAEHTGPAVALVAVLAGGLVAGWMGLVGMLVAVAVARAVRLPAWTGLLAGGLVALAGGAHALARAEEFQAHSSVAQVLALVGLFVAAAAVANGPAFFSRSSGRSST